MYFTRPNLQEISASASSLWFSRLRCLGDLGHRLLLRPWHFARERCSQPTPLSVLSTRNRRVSESRYSNRCRFVHGPDGAARSAKPLKPSRGVQCAHRFGMASGGRQRSLVIFSLCLVPSEIAHGLQSTCQDFDESRNGWPWRSKWRLISSRRKEDTAQTSAVPGPFDPSAARPK